MIGAVLDRFDRYTLLARQRPAFLALFPAAVAVLAIFPSLQNWWTALLAVVASCGVAWALGEFAQGQGKILEPGLFASWDGMPSVALLRHRDERIDELTKERYKAFLEKRVAGLRFPSEEEERRDPTTADKAYASGSNWLRTQTRDPKKFALLLRQNIGYGFRRNLLGLRLHGIGVAAFALVSLVTAQGLAGARIDPALIVAATVTAVALWYWLFVVRPSWVKIAADAYGRELLESCDALAGSTTAPNRNQQSDHQFRSRTSR